MSEFIELITVDESVTNENDGLRGQVFGPWKVEKVRVVPPALECVMLPVHRPGVAGGQSRITGGIVQLRFS